MGKQSQEIMGNLELWQGLQDPAISKRINDFLSRKLKVNSGVVGQEYSHLY